MFVVDASIALAWLLDRSDPDEIAIANQALRYVELHGAEIPALWFFEVANGLLIAERRQQVTQQDTAAFLADLAQIPIEVDPSSRSVDLADLISMGRIHNLTAYDATYLELALRRSATLATFDRKLAAAARAAGVAVYG